MTVIQFFQYLFHDGFTEKDRLGSYTKFFTILPDCSHFTIIQVYDLSVTTYQSRFLLPQIFRIYTIV